MKFDYYDINFNKLEMRQSAHDNSNYNIPKPQHFDKMVEIARKLSFGIPQVRIDLYYANNTILLSEFTFFHHGGFVPFIPEEYDLLFGNEINLPGKIR